MGCLYTIWLLYMTASECGQLCLLWNWLPDFYTRLICSRLPPCSWTHDLLLLPLWNLRVEISSSWKNDWKSFRGVSVHGTSRNLSQRDARDTFLIPRLWIYTSIALVPRLWTYMSIPPHALLELRLWPQDCGSISWTHDLLLLLLLVWNLRVEIFWSWKMNGRNSAGFLYMEHHVADCRETQERYLLDPETVDLYIYSFGPKTVDLYVYTSTCLVRAAPLTPRLWIYIVNPWLVAVAVAGVKSSSWDILELKNEWKEFRGVSVHGPSRNWSQRDARKLPSWSRDCGSIHL